MNKCDRGIAYLLFFCICASRPYLSLFKQSPAKKRGFIYKQIMSKKLRLLRDPGSGAWAQFLVLPYQEQVDFCFC